MKLFFICTLVILISSAIVHGQDENIELIAEIDYPSFGKANDLDISGNFAYCLRWTYLDVYDISDASNITLISQLNLRSPVQIIKVENNTAYIASYGRNEFYAEGEIIIVDISDPFNPEMEGNYEFEDGPSMQQITDIDIQGDYIYATAFRRDLMTFDISSYENIELITNFVHGLHGSNGIEVRGEIAYIASKDSGLQLLDIENYSEPEIVSEWNVHEEILGIEFYRQLAFVIYDSGMSVLYVGNSFCPIELFNIEIEGLTGKISFDNDLAYLTSLNGRVTILDVSDPLHPSQISDFTIDTEVNNVKICEDYAFVAGGLFSSIINVQNPLLPVIEYEYSGFSEIYDIELVGDQFVFITNMHGNIYTSNIVSPHSFSVYKIPGFDASETPIYLKTSGDRMVLISYENFYLFDITDLSQILLLDIYTFELSESIQSCHIDIDQDRLFICDGGFWENHLFIYDISSHSIQLLHDLNLGDTSWLRDFFVNNDYASISCDNEFIFVNISDNTSDPYIEYRFESDNISRGEIATIDDYVYIAQGNMLYIFRHTTANTLELENSININNLQNIDIFENRMFLNCSNKYRFYDITNRITPVQIGLKMRTPYYQHISINENYLIGSDFDFGSDQTSVDIYDLSQAQTNIEINKPDIQTDFQIAELFPNPFNASVNISVNLPKTGQLNICIYNTLGQVVAEIVDDYYTYGEHQFSYNGSKLPSGVYFINATMEGYSTQTRKITLVK